MTAFVLLLTLAPADGIADLAYPSRLLGQDVPIKVYTPPGYATSGVRYPVVYNLHGGGGSPQRQWDRTREALTTAMEGNAVRPMIYVYANGLGNTEFVNTAGGQQIERSIVEELIPFVDATYRTVPTRGGRAVDGFSMGGFGCLSVALRHPDLFSSVVSYGAALTISAKGRNYTSPEHFAEHNPADVVKARADAVRGGLRVRVVCGTEDKLYPSNVAFKELLGELRISCEWVPVPGVGHDTKGLYDRVGLESLRFIAAGFDPPPPTGPPRVRVSDNKRHLVTTDGKPFFYLADTAWELFHRCDRKQAADYLKLRAEQRFTVIQAVALAEVDGLTDPNPYGKLPLTEGDPARPAVTPGADPAKPDEYDYWDHVDYVVDEANRRGLAVALLPAWGRWVHDAPPRGGQLTAANAPGYGEFLGKRYGGKGVIWVLGGDRRLEGKEDVWRALARGIKAGTGPDAVMTFHPRGGGSSSENLHADDWLSFNMQQTGHNTPAKTKGWEKIAADYARTPVKPVVDGEPLYEDHPIGFKAAKENGFSTDAHVRQRAYWHTFAGAAGFTYGNHAVWQMYAPGRRPINGPLFYWTEAIHRPGAAQMQHLRALAESRPGLSRVPAPDAVADPLDGPDRIQACRGDGYLFVYTGTGRRFTVTPGKELGERVTAWWYNPRNGAATAIGTFPNASKEFVPQFEGLGSDWVLVLDDASKNYPPPGRP